MKKLVLQLRNIVFFLYALPFVIFWNRRKPIPHPQKILIVQFAKLGDMVCTTPVFHAIKKKFPQAKVFVVGDSINEKILAGNPDVDKYIVASEKNMFATAQHLRKEHFDFACTMGPTFVALLLLIFSGAKTIATYKISGGKANQTRTYKILQHFTIPIPYAFGEYLSRTHLRLLEPIGIFSEDTKKHLYITSEAQTSVEKLFTSHGVDKKDFIVGISSSAGGRNKEWPPQRFAEISNYLSKRYNATIVLIGGPNDQGVVSVMLAYLEPSVKFLNTAGMLTIEELKAIVSRINLFISVDTGPIYIAEAFDVPTIDILGPLDINEQAPRGPLHRAIVPKNMKKVLRFAMNVRNHDIDDVRKEVESITVEMVKEVIDELIARI
jgi:ADP-heptose:LPS heptosyltransferase